MLTPTQAIVAGKEGELTKFWPLLLNSNFREKKGGVRKESGKVKSEEYS